MRKGTEDFDWIGTSTAAEWLSLTNAGVRYLVNTGACLLPVQRPSERMILLNRDVVLRFRMERIKGGHPVGPIPPELENWSDLWDK